MKWRARTSCIYQGKDSQLKHCKFTCTGEAYVERCVEDHSHSSGGQYREPQYTSVPQRPRPSYGGANSAISPRTLGDTAKSIEAEAEKSMHSEVRAPRKTTNTEDASSSLAFYDGILTPSSSDVSSKQAEVSAFQATFKKPVYGPAERH